MERVRNDVRGGLLAATVLALAFLAMALYQFGVAADGCHWGPDGAVYRFQARTLAQGMLTAPAPPEPDSFRIPGVLLREGRWVGRYYLGFPLILAVGERIGLPWLVNPLLGGLLVLGTFLLGRTLFGATAGVLAALFVAVSPLIRTMSTTYYSHVACACLLLWAALALLRARGGRTSGRACGWAAVAGFLFGWALVTRPYTAVFVFVPLAIVLATALRPDHRRGLRLIAAFGLAAAPWTAGIVLWNRLLTGDWTQTVYQVLEPYTKLGFHPIPRLPGCTAGVYSPAVAWSLTWRQLESLGATFLPLPFSGLLLLLLPAVCLPVLGRRAAVLWGVAILVVGGHLLYPGTTGLSTVLLGPRYYTEILPALAVLVAAALTLVVRRHRLGAVAVGLGVAALMLRTALVSVPEQLDRFRRYHELPITASSRILADHLATLEDEPRVVFVDISTFHRSCALLQNRPDLAGPNIVAIYLDPPRNRAVLDAFPGRRAHLFRWDRRSGDVEFTDYVPEEDAAGPPRVFPYTRKEFAGIGRAR
jgi:hypothetical protein